MVDYGYAENEQAHRRSVSDRTRRKTYARSSSRRNVFPSGGPLRLHRIPLAQKRRRLLDPESGLPRRTHRPFREASDYSRFQTPSSAAADQPATQTGSLSICVALKNDLQIRTPSSEDCNQTQKNTTKHKRTQSNKN